jgi:hypothetical protein
MDAIGNAEDLLHLSCQYQPKICKAPFCASVSRHSGCGAARVVQDQNIEWMKGLYVPNEYEERRKRQVTKVVAQLWPEEPFFPFMLESMARG